MTTNSNVVSELMSHWSDYHKEFYGYRPRFATPDQVNSEQWLTEQIAEIDRQIEDRKKTFEGRESLRADGWIIEETDPELIKRAELLEKYRATLRNF
jgi:hypothetical protein